MGLARVEDLHGRVFLEREIEENTTDKELLEEVRQRKKNDIRAVDILQVVEVTFEDDVRVIKVSRRQGVVESVVSNVKVILRVIPDYRKTSDFVDLRFFDVNKRSQDKFHFQFEEKRESESLLEAKEFLTALRLCCYKLLKVRHPTLDPSDYCLCLKTPHGTYKLRISGNFWDETAVAFLPKGYDSVDLCRFRVSGAKAVPWRRSLQERQEAPSTRLVEERLPDVPIRETRLREGNYSKLSAEETFARTFLAFGATPGGCTITNEAETREIPVTFIAFKRRDTFVKRPPDAQDVGNSETSKEDEASDEEDEGSEEQQKEASKASIEDETSDFQDVAHLNKPEGTGSRKKNRRQINEEDEKKMFEELLNGKGFRIKRPKYV